MRGQVMSDSTPATAACRFCNEQPAVVGGVCGTCDEELLDGLADHFGVTRAPKCPVEYQQGYKCDRPLPCPFHGNPIRL